MNYADDLVILCPKGRGQEALAAMRLLMARLGLTVNEKQTRPAKLPDDHSDFLGSVISSPTWTRPCP